MLIGTVGDDSATTSNSLDAGGTRNCGVNWPAGSGTGCVKPPRGSSTFCARRGSTKKSFVVLPVLTILSCTVTGTPCLSVTLGSLGRPGAVTSTWLNWMFVVNGTEVCAPEMLSLMNNTNVQRPAAGSR